MWPASGCCWCHAGHKAVQPTHLFWLLAQSNGVFLTELVGNQAEHLESVSVLKPAKVLFTLKSEVFFRAERFLISLSHLPGVSTGPWGKPVPPGTHCNPITGAIPTEFKTILTRAFTDTSDLFLKAPLCFQESFTCSACFQELPRQYQEYAPLYWALGLSSEQLGNGDFNMLKCPLCLTERNRSINFSFGHSKVKCSSYKSKSAIQEDLN